jgi:predicted AAA+ superfamily ATPase
MAPYQFSFRHSSLVENLSQPMKDDSPNSMDCSKAEKVLWAFTPSRSNPEDLESILVQRHHLLADAVERIRESVLTDNKHHLLFVGPRGSGKSFIVTVVVNRLCADKNLKDRLRIAWLNEDETCTTFLEFLARIFEALVKRYPDEYKAEILERAYEISAEDAPGYLPRYGLNTCLPHNRSGYGESGRFV